MDALSTSSERSAQCMVDVATDRHGRNEMVITRVVSLPSPPNWSAGQCGVDSEGQIAVCVRAADFQSP